MGTTLIDVRLWGSNADASEKQQYSLKLRLGV